MGAHINIGKDFIVFKTYKIGEFISHLGDGSIEVLYNALIYKKRSSKPEIMVKTAQEMSEELVTRYPSLILIQGFDDFKFDEHSFNNMLVSTKLSVNNRVTSQYITLNREDTSQLRYVETELYPDILSYRPENSVTINGIEYGLMNQYEYDSYKIGNDEVLMLKYSYDFTTKDFTITVVKDIDEAITIKTVFN